ncbi:MAG: N-formylglutamate amidohydrolase [Thermodesulfovibrionales bacterium]
MRPEAPGIIVTCEHSGNLVPEAFAALFSGREELLASHRGYDPGALELAACLAVGLKARLFSSSVTRLLIDLNRSPRNPARFSEITAQLSRTEKEEIEAAHYLPYREQVESAIASSLLKGDCLLHLSIHSFTPVLHGQERRADMGLLYDPARKAEAEFCISWQDTLSRLRPDLLIRRNYPYRGNADGFTSYLRKIFPDDAYIGIELEVNQKFPLKDAAAWQELKELILKSLVMIFR